MNPAQHAERAVLGSILVEPARLHEVAGWIEPDDFGTARHRLAHEAILRVASGRGVPDPYAVLASAATDPDARHNQVDGPFLHTLTQAAPSADRIVSYAHMVVEASIHRAVAQHAARLGFAAVAEGADDVVADRILHETNEALTFLDGAEKRRADIGGATATSPSVAEVDESVNGLRTSTAPTRHIRMSTIFLTRS